MARKAIRQFDNELRKLFSARTYTLRPLMQRAPGAAPNLNRQRVRRAIARLQNQAADHLIHAKEARSILSGYDYKKQWHPKRGKGWGRSAKKQNFKHWYDTHITTRNCLYAFWRRSTCLYVGRTLNGKGRPTTHFEKYWFGKTTRVDVYGFDRKRGVPHFECLLTHREKPSYFKVKPAKKK